MELNFSNRGLLAFDATLLSSNTQSILGPSSQAAADQYGVNNLSQEASGPTAAAICSLDLSHNIIHTFTGGTALRHVTILDLSHNALARLTIENLPGLLRVLIVSHNNLSSLRGLAKHVPRLEHLEAAHNQLISTGIEHLPVSLTNLGLQHNALERLDALVPLQKLAKLNAAQNPISDVGTLRAVLPRLPCLHFLDLRGTPVVGSADDSSATVASLAPRLNYYNGNPLSQASNNSMFKATRTEKAQKKRSSSGSGSVAQPQTRGTVAVSARVPEVPLEVRLMETKVKELRRLVTEASRDEEQARQQRGLLVQHIKGCVSVIDSQALELEGLQKEIEALRREKAELEESATSVELTFEQTHTSLLASKVNPPN